MRKLACLVLLSLASLSGAKAVTLTAWTFDNLSIGFNSSPTPSTGLGTASAIGMGSGSNPDIQSLAGRSTGAGGPNSWRIRATGGSIGWSTNAPIGTQGAKFAGSTFGYYGIKASFDVYATSDGEANLQVQYTTQGSIWHNLTNLTSAGT